MHASVGPYGGETVNENVFYFAALMHRLHLSAYNSFFDAGDTWCSASGAWHRTLIMCADLTMIYRLCRSRCALMILTSLL